MAKFKYLATTETAPGPWCCHGHFPEDGDGRARRAGFTVSQLKQAERPRVEITKEKLPQGELMHFSAARPSCDRHPTDRGARVIEEEMTTRRFGW
jgi:hypothetical protein